MSDEQKFSKLQFTSPAMPSDNLGKVKAHILEALAHVEREDPSAAGTTELVAIALNARDMIAKPVRIEFTLKFSVDSEVYPYIKTSEEEFLEDLMAHVIASPETLTKSVAEEVHGAVSKPHKLFGDVTLDINVVHDREADEITEDEEPSDEEVVTPHQQVEMSYRSSGLPVILDADSDPFNRVLGMEFPLQGHYFKAAFANGSGTVIHLYEKVGRKWRPLCDRRNAVSTNGISIQSSRDHRKYCEQCENKYANKVVD
jgi:hypothetical protein